MQSQKFSLRLYGKALLLSAIALLLILLLCALLLEFGKVPEAASELLVIITVVATALIGSYSVVRHCGEPMQGYVYGGMLFMFLFIMSFFACGPDFIPIQMLKRMISVFAGTITGNLFGRRKYYKLRNHGKRRRKTTK